MITIFELQSQSGQLWTEIVAHFEAKDSAHAAEVASLHLTHQTTTDAIRVELETTKAALVERNALIESAKTAIKGAIADANLDDAATVATIAQVVAAAELPTIEKRKLAIEAEIAAKKAELDSLFI
jgi:hypothetical protein